MVKDKLEQPEEPESVEGPVVEVVEERAEPMTIDDIRERATGLVNNVRNVGVASVMNRTFAALEGFFGGLAGDNEKKPPKE